MKSYLWGEGRYLGDAAVSIREQGLIRVLRNELGNKIFPPIGRACYPPGGNRKDDSDHGADARAGGDRTGSMDANCLLII